MKHRRASFYPNRRSVCLALRVVRRSLPQGIAGPPGFPNVVLPRMHGVSDRAGFRRAWRWRRAGWGLPRSPIASAPRSGSWISRLKTRPARPPVNASSVRVTRPDA